jgi:hypothetical protein
VFSEEIEQPLEVGERSVCYLDARHARADSKDLQVRTNVLTVISGKGRSWSADDGSELQPSGNDDDSPLTPLGPS